MSVTIQNKLNMSNRNFCTFFSALGAEFDSQDLCGEFDSKELLILLSSFDPELAIRADNQQGNILQFGITKEQVERYVKTLTELCKNNRKLLYC